MSEPFDPYYIWLGIPPEEQPADHYRLLGIRRFETNPDVISNAADQRVRHLRSLQTGKRQQESQRLLTEISQASGCLLDNAKRNEYDAKLRAQDAAKASFTAPPPVPVVSMPPVVPYVPPHAPPPPGAYHAPVVPAPMYAAPVPVHAPAPSVPAAPAPEPISLVTTGRRQKSFPIGAVIGGSVALVVLLVGGAYAWKAMNKPTVTPIAQTPVTPPVTTPVTPPPVTPVTPEVTTPPTPETNPAPPTTTPVVPVVTPTPPTTTPATTTPPTTTTKEPTPPTVTPQTTTTTPPAPAITTVKAPKLPDNISVELGETADVLPESNFMELAGTFDRTDELVSTFAGQVSIFTAKKAPFAAEHMIMLDFTPVEVGQGLLIQTKIGGRRYIAALDIAGASDTVSGLHMVEGTSIKAAAKGPWCTHQKTLVAGERAVVELVTTRDRVVMMVNGDTIINWQGAPSTILPDSELLPAIEPEPTFAIAVQGGNFAFKKVQISTIAKHNLGTDNKLAMNTKTGNKEIMIDPSKPETDPDPSMPSPNTPSTTTPDPNNTKTTSKPETKTDTKTTKGSKTPLGKKGQKLEPGLMVRVTASTNHTPTEMLGTLTNYDEFQTAIGGPIRVHTGRNSFRNDFHYMGFGYLILDKDQTVTFNITNGIVLVDGAKLNTPTSGTVADVFEKKLRKGSHPFILRPYDPEEPGPKFDIKDADGNDCLFYSQTDLMIEIQKPVRYYMNNQRGPGVFIFGNQPE